LTVLLAGLICRQVSREFLWAFWKVARLGSPDQDAERISGKQRLSSGEDFCELALKRRKSNLRKEIWKPQRINGH